MRYIFFLFILSFQNLSAQLYFDQSNHITVVANGIIQPMPWAGGLNAPQFSEVDINLDGYEDIVAYDRDARLFVPFIYNPYVSISQYGYDYFPIYNSILPKSIHWAFFRDLNLDGKKDLITSSNGGAFYYKNTSTPYNTSFEFVEKLFSIRSSGPSPLFIGNLDIPVIEDVDFDGDLDILAFGVSGTFIDFNENISTVSGEYLFKVTDDCWGDFGEDGFTNDIYLDHPECVPGAPPQKAAEPLHTGSTISAYDMDNDMDMELFVGDVSFNNMVYLTNTPVDGKDKISSKNMNYPSAHPVDMPVFPAAYFIDFDHDGYKDMLVSPNTGSASSTKDGIWFYKNHGNNSNPDFVFDKKTAFQDQMIDLGRYSKVRLVDYNNDNLMDIVVSGGQTLGTLGLKSTVSLYKNTGTIHEPKFALVTEDFANLEALNIGLHLCPEFADLDNDNKPDMVIGKDDGTLLYFKNESNLSNPWNFTLNTTILSGFDVGYNATPTLYDLNQDGKTDLLVGNRQGRITYYQNTGSVTNPQFTLISSYLGNIELRSPTSQGFLDLDVITENGNTVIYAGTSTSGINRIENIDGNLSGTFTVSDSNVHNLEHVRHSSPALYDFNNDGYLDMLLGNIRGGIEYFTGIDEMSVSTTEYTKDQIVIYPNPVTNNLFVNTDLNWDNYTIYNIQGALIKKGVFTTTIPTDDLSSGQYLISFANKNLKEVHRFIKQ